MGAGHSTVEISGTLYVYGGFDQVTGQGVSDLYSYNISTHVWTDLSGAVSGSVPTGRGYHGAVAINGVMYVQGGQTSYNGGTVLSDLYSYDPPSQTWTDLTVAASGTAPTLSTQTAVEISGIMYEYGAAFSNQLVSYDPITQTWTDLTSTVSNSPSSSRTGAAIAAVGGLMYMFGGVGGGYPYSDLYSYDPVMNTWSGDLTSTINAGSIEARHNASAASLGGKLYVFGGRDGPTGGSATVNDLGDMNVFDPVGMTWTNYSIPTGGFQPHPRQYGNLVSDGSNLILVGGSVGNAMPYSGVVNDFDDFTFFDVNSGVWAQGAPPKTITSTLVPISGLLYSFGGTAGDDGYSNSLLSYDPGTQLWTDRSVPASGTVPTGRAEHSAVEIGGKMYVFGGTFHDSQYHFYDSLYSYDPAGGGTWTDISTPASGTRPSARAGHTAVAISGKMYIFGGYWINATGTSYSYFNELHSYDPATQTWADLSTPLAGSAPAVHDHSAVVISGKMYVFGGSGNSGQTRGLYRYDPATQEWADLSTPGGGTPPSARYNTHAFAIGDILYIFGGMGSSSPMNDFYAYDPAGNGNWTVPTTSGTVPVGREGGAVAVDSGVAYFVNGQGSSGPFLTDVQVYTP